MKPLMRSSIRTGLLAAAALQGAALTLVAPEAHATWYCGIVDGPGNGNTSAGGTNAEVWGATAALPAASGALPLFTGYNSTSTKIILQTASASSWGGSQCDGNHESYGFFTIDSTTSLHDGPGVVIWVSEVTLSYVDTSGSLNASIISPDIYYY